jgi:hypothetical protein
MPTVAALLRLGCILLCLLGIPGSAAAGSVVILSHRDGQEVPAGESTLLLRLILDPGQELRALVVRVDGAPVSSQGRGISVDAGDLDPALRRLRLVLHPGTHLVEVAPELSSGAAAPARIRLRVTEAAPADPLLRPRLYALIIGISRYHDAALRLRFPSKDAEDLAAVLRSQAGGLYRDVQVRLLLDEAASKSGVLDGLEWLQRQATARDVAVLFVAGHGIRDGSTGLYYFLPVDAQLDAIKRTQISQDEFLATLRSLPGKVLVFLDTCFAGQLMRRQDRSPPDLGRFVSDLVSAESGLVVFASSSGRQTSQESPDWQNGAFTRALVEGLSGRAAPLGRGIITLAMLELYLSDRVKQLTGGMQTPMVARPEAVQDFPLALPGRALPPAETRAGPQPAQPGPAQPSRPEPPSETLSRHQREQLRVDEFGLSYAVFRGADRRPISKETFFTTLARPDLLELLRARSTKRQALLISGGLGLASGLILTVAGGAVYAGAGDLFEVDPVAISRGRGLMAGGGITAALGLGLLLGGLMVRTDPLGATAARALAEAHNERLRLAAQEAR